MVRGTIDGVVRRSGPEATFAAATPMTVNLEPLIRMVWPMGSVPPAAGSPNRSVAIWRSEYGHPGGVLVLVVGEERAVRQGHLAHRLIGRGGGDHLRVGVARGSHDLIPAGRPGGRWPLLASPSWAIARRRPWSSASGRFRSARRYRSARPAKPGTTVSRLEPADSMLAVIEAWLPVPTAVSAMTEAMPMTIPRTVNPERTLFAEMAIECLFE